MIIFPQSHRDRKRANYDPASFPTESPSQTPFSRPQRLFRVDVQINHLIQLHQFHLIIGLNYFGSFASSHEWVEHVT